MTASTSESDQTPPGDQDRVFNDETCRALRREGRGVGRVGAVVGTFVLGLYGLIVVKFALSLSPPLDFVVGITLSVVVSVATVTVMRSVNLVPTMPTRETLREAWTEINSDLRQQACIHAGDPTAIEAEVLDDTADPNARPELVFGLAPEECAPVFVPGLLVLVVAVSEFEGLATLLGVVGCIVLGGVMFVLVTHSPMKVNTYPPEDPPDIRRRDHADEESERGYQ